MTTKKKLGTQPGLPVPLPTLISQPPGFSEDIEMFLSLPMIWSCFQIQYLIEGEEAHSSAYKGKRIISMTQDFFKSKGRYGAKAISNHIVLGYPREESNSLKNLVPTPSILVATNDTVGTVWSCPWC